MSNLENNTGELINILQTINKLPPAGGGGIVPEGVIEISKNGVHNVATYATANVNVPIPDGYVLPAGTLEIDSNGSYGVANYAGVKVDVPSKEPVIEPFEITENGTYTAPDGVDGYSPITVNVAGSGGGNSDLPEGYKRCDYIEFSGNNWIDTLIKGNQDTQICVCFTWENSTQRHLFGCTSSDNTASITSYMNGSWRFGNKYATKSFSSKNPMLPYTVLVNKTTISAVHSATTISGVNDFETVGTLLLGGARDSDGSLPSVGIVGKVFYFYVWQGDEQVLKLIPITDGNGVYRFFDLISKTFFDSITSTPLSGGNW